MGIWQSPLELSPGRRALDVDRGSCLAARWPHADLRMDRPSPSRRPRRHAAGAGNPFGTPGDLIPPDETRVPAPARRDGRIRDTPCHIRATRCHQGESGRVLSRLQEPPLNRAGCRRALGKSGACGELGSRTANRMAVPQSPSIRERACPAWPGPARMTRGHRQGGEEDWTFSAGSTGRRTTTTSPSWTPAGRCSPGCGSPTTRPGWRPCWSCSRSTATASRTRCRRRSRRRGGCWWPACARRAARFTRSTRWRWPATGTGTRSRAASPTRATPPSWRTCCAPTCTRTGRCPPTASSPRPSRSWPAPSRTRSGSACTRRTSSARTCASTSPASWPPSAAPAAASPGPRPA